MKPIDSIQKREDYFKAIATAASPEELKRIEPELTKPRFFKTLTAIWLILLIIIAIILATTWL